MIHSEELVEKWHKMPFVEQMGNIGSDVGRAARWKGKDEKSFNNAVDRALELLDFTISDSRWQKTGRFNELTRLREVFCDAVLGGKEYNSSLEDLDKYFFQFALAARLGK